MIMNIFLSDVGLGCLRIYRSKSEEFYTMSIESSQIRPRPIDFESKKVENLFTVEMALGFNQSAGTTVSTSTSFEPQVGFHSVD